MPKYPRIFHIGGILVFVLLGIGMLGSFGGEWIYGLGIPLGFTLWSVLYFFIQRFDRKVAKREDRTDGN
jgi:phosphotransferase system  glucose/maltose/N-acetylglucosamine-specific IIC component